MQYKKKENNIKLLLMIIKINYDLNKENKRTYYSLMVLISSLSMHYDNQFTFKRKSNALKNIHN